MNTIEMSIGNKVKGNTYNIDVVINDEETAFFVLTKDRLKKQEATYLQNKFQEVINDMKNQ